MLEPHWTTYFAVITGLIGAICGITGSILGYIGYRRSNTLKSLDLRLELRKDASDLIFTVSHLEELIDKATSSRKAVASATGMSRSGFMNKWEKDVQTDKLEITALQDQVPSSDETFQNLAPRQLESKLVEVHTLQGKFNVIKDKYESALRTDDESRRQLKEDQRARFNQST